MQDLNQPIQLYNVTLTSGYIEQMHVANVVITRSRKFCQRGSSTQPLHLFLQLIS